MRNGMAVCFVFMPTEINWKLRLGLTCFKKNDIFLAIPHVLPYR